MTRHAQDTRRDPVRTLAGVAIVLVALLGVAALVLSALVARDQDTAATAAQVPAPAATRPAPSAAALSSVPPAEDPAAAGVAGLPDPDWVARTALAGTVPPRALTAYAGAALQLAQEDPGCGLGWNTLAAIGSVESGHGHTSGSVIDARGDVSPPVVGVPIDGAGVRQIADTDGGRLDGDTRWDRAVGPMQFIPGTWAAHQADGNGDGQADPQNIDDAALAAARYLCTGDRDLTREPDWIAAVAAYNDDVAYNNAVARAANDYAALQP